MCAAVLTLANVAVFASLRKLASSSIIQETQARSSSAIDSAILYLAFRQKAEQLTKSLNLLFANFNAKYQYPVIVFYDEENHLERFDDALILDNLTVSNLDKTLIKFERVQFEFPQGFSQANASQVTVWLHVFPAYNHMIAFWAYYVFQHPLVRKLQYFWRLDTDSYIIEPVKVDLFEMMRTNNYRYGYQHVSPEPGWVVNGLALFIQHYVRKNNVTVTQPDKLADALLGTGENVKVSAYYNNFEIVHVPTFLSGDMEAFRLAFLKTYRIYTHRWGDAPQRYTMVNLFLQPNEVHLVCECPYEHQNFVRQLDCV